jgi:protein MpaA
MKSFILGETSTGLPIPAYAFGPAAGPTVLILGGVHGDEREGVEACLGLLRRWNVNFPFHLRVTVVPALNMDGMLRCTRANARGVDLNRNMATNDWTAEVTNPRYNPGPSANSEPETQALAIWIDEHKPVFVFSMHSWQPMLNTNGNCEPEASAIAKWTGYTIKDSIGYPTPGCLGTYCGIERGMPTLTYEIERGLATEEILKLHVLAVEEGLKATESARRSSL